MKTINALHESIIILAVLLIAVSSALSNPDSLICGKKYKILSTNGQQLKGVLIAEDSLTITVNADHRLLKIPKEQIIEIVRPNEQFTKISSQEDFSTTKTIKIQNRCNITLLGGTKIDNVKIKKLNKDTLIVKNGKEYILIPVMSISTIVFPKESNAFLYGLGGGLVCGLITFFIMDSQRPDYSNAFLGSMSNNWYTGTEILTSIGVGIAGGLITGIIASSAGADEEYDFTSMDKETKINEIRSITEDSN